MPEPAPVTRALRSRMAAAGRAPSARHCGARSGNPRRPRPSYLVAPAHCRHTRARGARAPPCWLRASRGWRPRQTLAGRRTRSSRSSPPCSGSTCSRPAAATRATGRQPSDGAPGARHRSRRSRRAPPIGWRTSTPRSGSAAAEPDRQAGARSARGTVAANRAAAAVTCCGTSGAATGGCSSRPHAATPRSARSAWSSTPSASLSAAAARLQQGQASPRAASGCWPTSPTHPRASSPPASLWASRVLLMAAAAAAAAAAAVAAAEAVEAAGAPLACPRRQPSWRSLQARGSPRSRPRCVASMSSAASCWRPAWRPLTPAWTSGTPRACSRIPTSSDGR